MATLVSTLNTSFTPATGVFNVQCSGGTAQLERQNTVGAAWAVVGVLANGQASIVENPVAGANYRFVGLSNSPVVQADQ